MAGDLDILTCSGSFRNNGDGTFTAVKGKDNDPMHGQCAGFYALCWDDESKRECKEERRSLEGGGQGSGQGSGGEQTWREYLLAGVLAR